MIQFIKDNKELTVDEKRQQTEELYQTARMFSRSGLEMMRGTP
jgi:hypothetical protein